MPMTSEQLANLQAGLDEELARANIGGRCKLHRLAFHPASRRDTWRIFERLCEFHYDRLYPMLFLIGNTQCKTGIEVGIVNRKCGRPAFARNVSVIEAMSLWKDTYNGRSSRSLSDSGSFSDRSTELLLDYDSPFFWNPPPFISLEDGPPLFLLTKHLTQQELSAILLEIKTMHEDDVASEGGKKYALVEWDHEEDGNVDDMWRLTWKCYTYLGNQSSCSAIFIDKESATDQKVIVTNLL